MSLEEDGSRDLTADGLQCGADTAEAVIVAKQDGVVAGLKFLPQILQAVDPALTFEAFVDEGDTLRERMMIGALMGPVKSLFKVERPLMNFLSRLSGIASLTQQYVKALAGTDTLVLDTRKTVPGWRFLDKYAVTVGGGINHRMGLHDVAMLKGSHVNYAGSVAGAIQRFRAQDPNSHVIVEVRNLQELQDAIPHAKSFTRLLLDHFTLDQLKQAVDLCSGKIVLEASGGIDLSNVRDVALTGVHFVSVSALTNCAPGLDLAFQLTPSRD